MKKKSATSEGVALPAIWVGIVVAVSVLPALVTLVRAAQGQPTFGIAGDPRHMAVVEAMIASQSYTMPQFMGLCVALLLAPFCIAHFVRTGEIAPPLLSAGLLCVTLLDTVQALAAQGVLPAKTAAVTLVPLSWTLSRAFYAGAMALAFCGFLRSEKIKGEGSRRKATTVFVMATLLLVGVGIGILYLAAGYPGVATFLYAGSSLRLILNLVPLAVVLLLAAYVLPVYMAWQRTVFAQSLLLSCFPLALAQLHFAFGFGDHTGFQFDMANMLKLVAYLCTILGLVVDYHHTYNGLETLNRKLRNELFLAQQVRGVASYERHALQALLQSIPAPACFMDTSGNVTMMNEPFAHANGIGSEPGSDLRLTLSVDAAFGVQAAEEMSETRTQVIETGKAADAVVNWAGPDRLRQPRSWHLYPVRDDYGRTVAVVCHGEPAL